jgi:hypothetical protein
MTVELVRDGKPWWNDLTELASFGRWLTATGQAPRDIFEVVEKPWKWDDEHRSFLREEEMERWPTRTRRSPSLSAGEACEAATSSPSASARSSASGKWLAQVRRDEFGLTRILTRARARKRWHGCWRRRARSSWTPAPRRRPEQPGRSDQEASRPTKAALDDLSKDFGKVELEHESAEEAYQKFVDDFELGLWRQHVDHGAKLPPTEKLRLKQVAHEAMDPVDARPLHRPEEGRDQDREAALKSLVKTVHASRAVDPLGAEEGTEARA